MVCFARCPAQGPRKVVGTQRIFVEWMRPQHLPSHLITWVLGAFLCTGDGPHEALSILSGWAASGSGEGRSRRAAQQSPVLLSSPRPPHQAD